MLTVIALVAALLPVGWQAPVQAKPQLPKKSGVYAMTPQGAVALTVSGEPNRIERANGVLCYYAPGDFDRIPIADSIQSFYVSLIGWRPADLYLVVGRQQLTDPSNKYVRLKGRAITRGPVAFEIVTDDLGSQSFLQDAARRLSQGVAAEDADVYVVLELRNTEGLNDRAYPVRLRVAR